MQNLRAIADTNQIKLFIWQRSWLTVNRHLFFYIFFILIEVCLPKMQWASGTKLGLFFHYTDLIFFLMKFFFYIIYIPKSFVKLIFAFRDVMEKSFPEFYDYYESSAKANLHLTKQHMLVSSINYKIMWCCTFATFQQS